MQGSLLSSWKKLRLFFRFEDILVVFLNDKYEFKEQLSSNLRHYRKIVINLLQNMAPFIE